MNEADTPFERAMTERIDDPMPRLVYADWLAEQGRYKDESAMREAAGHCRVEPIRGMIGKVMSRVNQVGNKELLFAEWSGITHRFYHEQDCCENVYIEDVCGDLDDLVIMPILVAETVSHAGIAYESSTSTWTFYRFATAKGFVTVRWLGESNGYYSESVTYETRTEESSYRPISLTDYKMIAPTTR